MLFIFCAVKLALLFIKFFFAETYEAADKVLKEYMFKSDIELFSDENALSPSPPAKKQRLLSGRAKEVEPSTSEIVVSQCTSCTENKGIFINNLLSYIYLIFLCNIE